MVTAAQLKACCAVPAFLLARKSTLGDFERSAEMSNDQEIMNQAANLEHFCCGQWDLLQG